MTKFATAAGKHTSAATNPNEPAGAKRMSAQSVEVKSSHVPMISQPARVAKLIEEAAKATTK
jgi:hypothetical protein